jgi:acid phosphatase type 7
VRRCLLPGLLLLLLAASPSRSARCVRGPYLQNTSTGSIEIRWELDRRGRSSVEYHTGGETPRRVDSAFEGMKHRVRLTGLRPGERYEYRVWRGDERVSDAYRFRAAPAEPEPFAFAVFGDFGAGTREQLQVARLLERSPAEFALLCGDMVYGRGEEEHYDRRFFEPYRRSLRRMTFWPALGNHDVGTKDGAPALAMFDVPANGPAGLQTGRNYSFDYGSAHVAAIDSNASARTLRTIIGPWLEQDMAASTRMWKFVFMHHPPFSSANHGEDRKIKEVMVPVFTRAGVDIVFAGHDHAYERVRPQEGITYVVSGNGGARLYEHRNPHDYTAMFYNRKHGLTEVTIAGARLRLRHVNVDGAEVDRYEIDKTPAPRR